MYERRTLAPPRSCAYHKDQAQFLDKGPFQSVLVASIGWVRCGRLRIGGRNGASLFLDKRVGNEIVDNGGADGRICPGPENHAGRGENLESVQHVELGSRCRFGRHKKGFATWGEA